MPSEMLALVEQLQSWVNWGTSTLKRVSKVSSVASIWFLSLLSPADAVFSYLAIVKRGNALYLNQLSPINLAFLLTLGHPGGLILVWTIIEVWNMQKNSEGGQDFETALLSSGRLLDELDISAEEMLEEMQASQKFWLYSCAA